MVFAKSCPGSRTIREPRPEYSNCLDCGREVEIWTDELKATCPGCGSMVLRAQQASCIDWCPHAKECVGPEAYERLKPGAEEDLSQANTPREILQREHDRILENLGLLHGASLCLTLGNLNPQSIIREKGSEHLSKVLDFFDKDIGLHFRREEEILFAALEKHLPVKKSPIRLLLKEHGQVRQWYGRLREKLLELRGEEREDSTVIAAEVQEISSNVEHLLREHINNENESLLPLLTDSLGEDELKDITQRWKSLISK